VVVVALPLLEPTPLGQPPVQVAQERHLPSPELQSPTLAVEAGANLVV
jgi:hypothetical protein